MMRYINADKTLTYISRILGGLPLALLIECEKNGIDIVRCKECKWDKAQMIPKEVKCIYQHNADDFCSYGERREP